MESSIKNTKKRFKKNIFENEKFLPYLFIAPAAILIIVFLFYPVANVFRFSLFKHNEIMHWNNRFVGFENFKNIFTNDRVFWLALRTSFKWVFAQVSIQLTLGMIMALILNQSFKLRGLIRTLMFYPWAVSGVLTAMMWGLMYHQHIGVFNDMLLKLNLIDYNIAWLGNVKYVFGALVAAGVWRGVPFFTIMILARLQTIPADVYEAAAVDGTKPFQNFIYITLPYLKDSIILATLLRAVWEFNSVDLIMNLTGGGPARATTTLSLYIANTAISDMEFGYGSALAVISFFILLIFAMVYLKLSKFSKEA